MHWPSPFAMPITGARKPWPKFWRVLDLFIGMPTHETVMSEDAGIMIGKLKGRIDSFGTDWLIIDVSGVGYHVFCSSKTLAALPSVGEFAELIRKCW